MTEIIIDKSLANTITPFLHPNQIKHLAMHKGEYQKYLQINNEYVKIVVKAFNAEKNTWEEMYNVHSPELQEILSDLKGKNCI